MKCRGLWYCVWFWVRRERWGAGLEKCMQLLEHRGTIRYLLAQNVAMSIPNLLSNFTSFTNK